MRTRSAGLALLAGFAIVVSACSSGTASPAASGSALKIGLVTDVGTLNDKNFNQYSWEGAQAGATKIGAPAPKAAQSQASADIAKNIQSFVDQKYDIIVTVGFAAGADTIKAAKANPKIKFIGVDQAPCVDENGDTDPKFGCKGDAAKLLPEPPGHPVVGAAAGLPRRHRGGLAQQERAHRRHRRHGLRARRARTTWSAT